MWDVVRRLTGLPGGDRTPDPQLRRLMLYPTELRAGGNKKHENQLMVGAKGFKRLTLGSQAIGERPQPWLRQAPRGGAKKLGATRRFLVESL